MVDHSPAYFAARKEDRVVADGYIKLFRGWLDCPDLRDHTARGWWATILTRAAWSECEFRGRKIAPGEFGFSYRRLADEERVSVNTLRHWLDYFADKGMITLTSVGSGASRFTMLRVVNWHKFPNGVSNSHTLSVSTTDTRTVSKSDTQEAKSVSVSVSPSVSVTVPPTDTQKKKEEEEREEEDSLSAGADAGGETSEPISELELEFVSKFNSAPDVARNRGAHLTPKRRRAFRARCKEPGWLADYPKALAKFPLRCFQGQTDGWRPDTEWFLRPDTVARVLEGKYDWTKSNGLHRNSQQDPSRIRTGEYG